MFALPCRAADDLWTAQLVLTTDQTDVADLVWNQVDILSPTQPSPRSNHAAVSLGGIVRRVNFFMISANRARVMFALALEGVCNVCLSFRVHNFVF